MPDECKVTFDAERHAYTVNGEPVPSVTQILRDFNFVDPTYYTDEARDFGTNVHLCCQYDDEGTLEWGGLADAYKPYVAAWRAFRRTFPITWSMVEAVVGNAPWAYAGKLDRAGEAGGAQKQTWLIDIKTGAPAKWHGLQAWAYAACLDGMSRDGPRIKCACVYLNANSTFKMVEHDPYLLGLWWNIAQLHKWWRSK